MKKKKVLLLAYNFPPFIRAASLRTHSWFKDFSDEIDVTVITRKWSSNIIYNESNYFQEDEGDFFIKKVSASKKIIFVPNKYNFFFGLKNSSLFKRLKLNKLFTLIELLYKWTFKSYLDNENDIFHFADSYLKKEKFDVIIASGEPFSLFKYCYLLNQTYNIPYILDYRDAWTSNFSRRYTGTFLDKLIIKREIRSEEKFINNASGIVSVSQEILNNLQHTINSPQKEVISNGIDLEEFNKIAPSNELDSQFTITFVGSLYETHRLETFLNAVSKLVDQKKDKRIKLVFVGSILNCPSPLRKAINSFQRKYPEAVFSYDYVTHNESIALQKASTILLKFNAINQKEHHFGKKLYEYAASGRPVISVDSYEGMFHENSFFGDRAFQYFLYTEIEILDLLKEFYERWSNGVKFNNGIDILEMERYSSHYQTRKLESMIRELTKNPPHHCRGLHN